MSQYHLRVNPAMYCLILALWLGVISHFVGRFVDAVVMQSCWQGRTIAVTAIAWIVFMSFYACFHMMSFSFSLAVRIWSKDVTRHFDSAPPVVILYPCMNDFRERSVASCLAQDYLDYAVYILDDSTVPAEQRRVAAFCARHGNRAIVIRRADRSGFKAGNLNHALREIGAAYKYICIVDADELLPASFLRETVAIAEGNPSFGFVQASHGRYAETAYGEKTGDGIDLHWDYFLPARNHFGFVYTYGHGVLIRHDSLRAVGGFPEVASEDIALSTKLREAGYRGYFAFDIRSFEESPPSYVAFRRRTQKMTSGTLQFFVNCLPSFFRSEGVSMTEKIDLFLATFILYLPAVFVFFVVALHCEMLLAGNAFNNSLMGFRGQYSHIAVEVLSPLRTTDFSALVLVTIFAPLCYLIPNMVRSPARVFMYVLRMGSIHVSTCVSTFWALLKWVLTRQVTVFSTGDRSLSNRHGSIAEYMELSLGVLAVLSGLWAGSLCLASVGVSLILVRRLSRRNLDGRAVTLLLALPIFMTLLATLGAPLAAVGTMGMFAGLGLGHA